MDQSASIQAFVKGKVAAATDGSSPSAPQIPVEVEASVEEAEATAPPSPPAIETQPTPAAAVPPPAQIEIPIKSDGGTAVRPLANVHTRGETNGRENNEDGYMATALRTGDGQTIGVLAVADGMGGHEHGELVSREALRRLGQYLFEVLVLDTCCGPIADPLKKDPEAVLDQGLHLVNSQIRRMIEKCSWGTAGSTIAVALIAGDRCTFGNLGDSPVLHYSAQSRSLRQLTDDHTVAGAMVRAGQITEDMARHHEQRSVLEFFIGRDGYPSKPPIKSLKLAPDDLLVLCSDGIIAHQTIAEIEPAFQSGGTSEELAERLMSVARAKGETDNQTIVIWRHQRPTRAKGGAL